MERESTLFGGISKKNAADSTSSNVNSNLRLNKQNIRIKIINPKLIPA